MSSSAEELQRRRTRKLYDMGFSEQDIRAILLELCGPNREGTTADTRAAFTQRLTQARNELRRLVMLERDLEQAMHRMDCQAFLRE
jgi:transketolase C-terminal domain/subunit